ncbi:hypothetical protein MNBD_GAMMA20-2415 [hydrothermal vent metagenome]|uniref:General secretion pathway protein M n=1 Tax=hydrothermal vent metagenome TaxID=652676 RepID=A0A3B1A4Q5_9ZZZZ
MKTWFESLDLRERRMLIIGSVLLGVMLFYLLVWEPLEHGVETLRKSNAEQQTQLQWMQQAVDEVKQLRGGSGRPAQLAKGQSLLSAIDDVARSNQLADALKRVQPDGRERARVWLEGASFDRLVHWVDSLQRQQGVDVVSSVFEAREEVGRVDARLVFETGGGA